MAEVQLIEEKVMLPKEANDVRKFLVHLVGEIKAKKPVAEIVGGSLAHLMAAIEGFEQLDDEAKHPAIAKVVGLLAGEIGEVFMQKPEAAPVEPVAG